MATCPSCASLISSTDQYCNNCGAKLPHAGPTIRRITAITGGLGALIAAFPVSVLKLFLFIGGWPCYPLTPAFFNNSMAVSTCGVFYSPWGGDNPALLVFLAFLLLGGGLSGLLAGEISILKSRSRSVLKVSRWNYLWGFLAWTLFDLVFVFIILYPGQ